tara:strand:+ start:506 stop:751 length:246 start_codon:yes stop_codon:yes gene_type:complete
MKCLEKCKKKDTPCSKQECRHWIDYKEDYNCVLQSIDCHGAMTLREIADRLGLSFVRVQQIEKAALKKMRRNARKHSIYNE